MSILIDADAREDPSPGELAANPCSRRRQTTAMFGMDCLHIEADDGGCRALDLPQRLTAALE
jgi:hypothetical protein